MILSLLSLSLRLCRAGATTWSVNFPVDSTIWQILPLCEILLSGHVGALATRQTRDRKETQDTKETQETQEAQETQGI